MIKKGNKIITVSLDPKHLLALEILKKTLKTKNNSKAIKYLLDIETLNREYLESLNS